MMNKSLRGIPQESSSKTHYGFHEVGCVSLLPLARSGQAEPITQKRAAVSGGFES
jgi:hypothetical protein